MIDSLRDMEAVIRLNPRDRYAHRHLIKIHTQRGESARADELKARLYKIDPKFKV